jgi:hypothetical protein
MKILNFRKIVPLLAFVGVPLLTAVACGNSASNSPTNDGGTPEGSSSSCTPGRQVSCPCAGGGQGVQVCNDEGTGYGPCGCGDASMTMEAGQDATKDTGSDGSTSGDGPCNCVEGGGDSGGGDAPADHSMQDTGTPEVGGDGGGCIADAGVGGTLNWAERFGVTGATDVTSLALDPTNGVVALAGYFSGSTDFGSAMLSSGDASSGVAGFLATFDSAGTNTWTHAFTGGGVTPASVAVDGSGDLLLGGSFTGTADFGGGAVSSTSLGDIFWASFNSAGTNLWVKHLGSAPSVCCAFLRQAVLDPSGNAYLVGELYGNALDLGCGSLPSNGSEFIAKFDPSGQCVWSQGYGPFGHLNYTQNEVLALDDAGNVIVAGGFYGTINFGTGAMTAPSPGMDVFIQKFTAGGTVLWAESFGVGASVAQATGIGTDGSGNILLDGTFSQTLDLGCATLTESGLTGAGDIFIAKLDASGNCDWSQSFGDPNQQLGGPLAVNACGDPAITGGFSGVVDFGGGALNAAQDGSMYLASFRSSGAYQWAYAGGPPLSNVTNSGGLGIAASSAAVVTTGTFQGGTLSLSGNQLTAVSQQDTYLASFIE